MSVRIATLLWSVLVVVTLRADDWPRFRGPDGSGVTAASPLPMTWSEDEHVVWRRPLPGPGSSSPILCGTRLFVTCYTGYGLSAEEPGRPDDLNRVLLCFDRASGELQWAAEEPDNGTAESYDGFVKLHGYASSTPATDGTAVYTFYGGAGVFAYDLDGVRKWHASVGNRNDAFGSGASPILFENLVIVNANVEDRSLVALDRRSGAEVWRTGDINRAWSTPTIATTAVGNPELVLGMKHAFKGFDPRTGEELWSCEGVNGYVCPSGVARDDVVYAIGGRRGMAVAIRTGGRGDVSATHRLWVQQAGSNVSSPVYHDGHLYWISDTGIAFVLDAATGKMVTRRREADAAPMYASMAYGDGRFYAVSRENGTFVYDADPALPLLAHNVLEDDGSPFNGSPAFSVGRIYLRSDRFLYCLGE